MPSTTPIPVRFGTPASLSTDTALIIGGSSGIGLAAASLLRAAGGNVILLARNPERLAAAATQIRGIPSADTSNTRDGGDWNNGVLEFSADGTDENALHTVLAQAGPVQHILVTAGAYGGPGPLTQNSRAAVENEVSSRVWGAYGAAQAAAAHLEAGGSLTLTSGALVARPIAGTAAAVAGVGAVEALTRGLAVELAPQRLRVNTIRYGIIDTPMSRKVIGAGVAAADDAMAQAGAHLPLGRFGTAEEAAAAALFVMSNSYITGTVLVLDGGHAIS